MLTFQCGFWSWDDNLGGLSAGKACQQKEVALISPPNEIVAIELLDPLLILLIDVG